MCGSQEKIGIPECDDYAAKVMACIKDKVPPSMQEASKNSISQSVQSWKDLASDEQMKSALKQACKQATETAKKIFATYGCSL